MALTECPECGEPLSSSATQCPHCGIAGPHLADAHGEKARQGVVSTGALLLGAGVGAMVFQNVVYGPSESFEAWACSGVGAAGAIAMALIGALILIAGTRSIGEYIVVLFTTLVMAVGIGLALAKCFGA